MLSKRQKIPFYIVSGFLGSGKTNFIQNLLQSEPESRTKIFVNELAAQGIDQYSLASNGANEISLLADGCLCCDRYGPFIAQLEESYSLWQKKSSFPERIILESSGFFIPQSLLKSLFSCPFFLQHFCYKGLVTVIDIFSGIENLTNFVEARKQIECADLILLTKTEKAPSMIIERLQEKIAQYNATAPLYDKVQFFQQKKKLQHLSQRNIKEREESLDRLQHTQTVETFVFSLSKIEAQSLSLCDIEEFFSYLSRCFGDKILRIKALLQRKDSKKIWLFQSVQNIFYPYEELSSEAVNIEYSYFVVIMKKQLKVDIEQIFNAFFYKPQSDNMDRDALLHNPLAVANFTF